MRDFRHLMRLMGVFAGVLAVFLGVRALAIPATFGRIGHYRAAAVDDVKAMPVRYAGRSAADACAGCHEEIAGQKAAGRHRGLWCETCHGPAGEHVDNPGEVKPARPARTDSRVFCLRCHEDNHSRPKGHPVVTPAAHHPKAACVPCHAPHSPHA